MRCLPKDHDFHVESAAAGRASDLLGLISENFNITPPRVMPQDGEAVVFTWDYGDLKRYLTVDENDLDVMDLHKTRRVRCVHDIEVGGDQPYAALVKIIGVDPVPTTMMENDV